MNEFQMAIAFGKYIAGYRPGSEGWSDLDQKAYDYAINGTDLTEVTKMEGELTLELLEKMQPQTIFAKGTALDSQEGLNMTRSGKMLRWVAIRGENVDWAIYCHFADMDYEWIKKSGDKVTLEKNIRKLVPCTDEAFEKYRY